MAANTDAIIREGIAAYKAGRKEEARAFLLRAVEIDQYNEQAWLWLSAVVEGPEDQRTCLENVLAINPNNERARHGLDVLSQPADTPPPPKPPVDSFPTSVEWATDLPLADSFEDHAPATSGISDEEYDDWVANLNLPSSAPTPAAPPVDDSRFAASDPFGGAFFDDGNDDLDESLLQSNDSFSANPFSTLDFETVYGTPEAAAMPPPPPPEPPRASTPPGLMSPGREADDDDEADDDIFGGVDLRASGVFTDFSDDEFTGSEFESLDADELFQYIPPEIRATRLPGTRERYPVMLTFGLVLLVLLNAGALALLVYRLL